MSKDSRILPELRWARHGDMLRPQLVSPPGCEMIHIPATKEDPDFPYRRVLLDFPQKPLAIVST